MIPLMRNWSYYNIPFSFFLILVAGFAELLHSTASLILVRPDVHQKLTAAAPFGGHPQRSTQRPTIWRLSKITSNSLETREENTHEPFRVQFHGSYTSRVRFPKFSS